MGAQATAPSPPKVAIFPWSISDKLRLNFIFLYILVFYCFFSLCPLPSMKFTNCGTFESGSYHLQMQYKFLHVLICTDLDYPLCEAFVAPTWVPCRPTCMESLVQFFQYIAWDMPSSRSDVIVVYTFHSFFSCRALVVHYSYNQFTSYVFFCHLQSMQDHFRGISLRINFYNHITWLLLSIICNSNGTSLSNQNGMIHGFKTHWPSQSSDKFDHPLD